MHAEDNDTNEKVWEKCARLLMLNSPMKLDELLDIVSKVIKNAVEKSQDSRFRTLKMNNSTVKNKIIDVPGGLEFLIAVGFEVRNENENKVLFFPHDSVGLQSLETGLTWLINTVHTCKGCSDPTNLSHGCAQCIISVRMPTGSSVLGGFMKGDKLSDVRSFACCYFMQER